MSLPFVAVLIGIALVWQFGGTLSYHRQGGAGHSKAGSARYHLKARQLKQGGAAEVAAAEGVAVEGHRGRLTAVVQELAAAAHEAVVEQLTVVKRAAVTPQEKRQEPQLQLKEKQKTEKRQGIGEAIVSELQSVERGVEDELQNVEQNVERSVVAHASEIGRLTGVSRHQKRPNALELGASHSQCAHRRPYHVILPATKQRYQEWQTRINYYHYLKQRSEHPCSDLGGFTRLLSSQGGTNDTLANEIPTFPVEQLKPGGCEMCDHGFVVLNRPYGFVQFVKSTRFRGLAEKFVFIVEPDHLLMRPPKNSATQQRPVGFGFYYMTHKYDTYKLKPVVERFHDPDQATSRTRIM